MIPTTVRRMTATHLLPGVITRADGGSLAAPGIRTNARVRSAAKVLSKRLGSPYRSGRTDHWIKVKNPAAPAVKREAGEDGGADERRR